jgi:hypothetical protein
LTLNPTPTTSPLSELVEQDTQLPNQVSSQCEKDPLGGGKGPLISEDISLTLATGNGQVLINPNDVKVGPLTASGMANAKGTETSDSHHIVIETPGREREQIVANCLPAELYHHGTVVNQDVNQGHLVISTFEGLAIMPQMTRQLP